MLNTDQLELGLDKQKMRVLGLQKTGKQNRINRARWWFAQMRRVVDMAIDWKPTPPARPEQVYLSLVARKV